MNQAVELGTPIYSSLGDDPDLGEIVEMFVDEMPDRTATLRKQWEAGDWEELRRTAHQIKGAAGSYGFNQITPFAAALEVVARDAATPDSAPEEELLHDLQSKLDELISWCERVQAGAPQ